MQNFRVLKISF